MRAALHYIFGQGEQGPSCPIAMTFAAVPALRHQKDVADEWVPRLIDTRYDRRFIPAGKKTSALMGMAMSPMLDTFIHGWVAWFGGRQAARTLHFILAWLLLAFLLVHVFEVLISGVWNHLRSMITGWFAVEESGSKSSTDKS